MSSGCCRRFSKVDRYDGHTVWVSGRPAYEVGNYLGGGAAGVVYEGTRISTLQRVAIKILNPVGYRMWGHSKLQRSIVIHKGDPTSEDSGRGLLLEARHIWWLLHQKSKQIVAAYADAAGNIREPTLPQCIDLWGLDPSRLLGSSRGKIVVQGTQYSIPCIPIKFARYCENRRRIFREIDNMCRLGFHKNIIMLEEVLEFIEDSKTTIFLALELASGGELFDRIKVDQGVAEDTARYFFMQLLSGLGFLHAGGVCHRDLKPENLLLDDGDDAVRLKIADFGLSAILESQSDEEHNAVGENLRRLQSVVGSPHYVAPEVLSENTDGYDGTKADVWSIGVILYAMLAGNLPFSKDLLNCLRFQKFSKWWAGRSRDKMDPRRSDDFPGDSPGDEELPSEDYPSWLFPSHFSVEAKSLISLLLHPEPSERLSVEEAHRHIWVIHGLLQDPASQNSQMKEMEGMAQHDIRPLTLETDQLQEVSGGGPTLGPQLDEGKGSPLPGQLQLLPAHTSRTEIREAQGRQRSRSPTAYGIFHSPPLASTSAPDCEALDDFSLDSKCQISDRHAAGWPSSLDLLHRAPPSFHDMVKRSTRFVTSVPATEVLKRIEQILKGSRHSSPATVKAEQDIVEIHWETYSLHLERTGAVLCSVQIFLLNTGLYMVEFQRGQLDIFQFKRLYESIRMKLKTLIRRDYALEFLGTASPTRPGDFTLIT